MNPHTQALKIAAPVFSRAVLFAALAAFAAPAFSQSCANGQITGSFRFRYVGIVGESSSGVVTETTAAEGVMVFDGQGNYTISAGSQWVDTSVSGVQGIPANASGAYGLNSAGSGYLNNPDPNPNLPANVLYGSCTQGVIVASSTEENTDPVTGLPTPAINDMFVAIGVGPIPSNASFTNPFWVGAIDFAAGTDVDVKNAMFQILPDGKGNLGSLTITGQANNVNGTALTQKIATATYNFGADGNAQFSFPAPTGVPTPQILMSGARNVYVSADGDFLLGWSTTGYDIMFGVKALPSTVAGVDSLYTGTYYLGGLGDNPTAAGVQNCGPYSFWGSLDADGAQNQVEHQRLFFPSCGPSTDPNTGFPISWDFGSWNLTTMNPDGSGSDEPLGFVSFFGNTYGFGDAGGNCDGSGNVACAFVAIANAGAPATMSLHIGIHAPNFSGSGIFLNPIGVVNAASYAPTTSSVAPGELLTLFGSFGNVPTLVSTGGQPFPPSLGPIQVFIDGIQSPIYYVSSGQIAVIAPLELANVTTGTVQVQVSNNSVLSNAVSVNVFTLDNPGVYAALQSGIGFAAAIHADFTPVCDPQVVTTCTGTPAKPGETIILALSGMGLATPAIGDGQVPSTTALSYANDFTNGNLLALFHDYDNGQLFQQGTITFAGLYPGFASLYQMNITVPTTVGPGDDIFLDLLTPYAETIQVAIPVGGSANASSMQPALSRAAAKARMLPRQYSRRPPVHPLYARPRVPAVAAQPLKTIPAPADPDRQAR